MCVVLFPFTDELAVEISSWILSAEEASAWAGGDTTFPLAPDQFRRWHDDSDVHSFIVRHDGDLVAYGELWVDRAEQEIELARIIVHPARRGIGIGRAFVTALVRHAAAFELPNLFVRVAPDNGRAIRCYESAGFVRVSTNDQETYNRGQRNDYVWMKYAISSGSRRSITSSNLD